METMINGRSKPVAVSMIAVRIYDSDKQGRTHSDSVFEMAMPQCENKPGPAEIRL